MPTNSQLAGAVRHWVVQVCVFVRRDRLSVGPASVVGSSDRTTASDGSGVRPQDVRALWELLC
jgi:hypothetical protein